MRQASAGGSVTISCARFDELIVNEAIATAHTATPKAVDIASLVSHGMSTSDADREHLFISCIRVAYGIYTKGGS